MSEVMKSILCRVLSTEIGNQQIWKAKDVSGNIDRDAIIEEIKQFMEENDIRLEWDYVINARG